MTRCLLWVLCTFASGVADDRVVMVWFPTMLLVATTAPLLRSRRLPGTTVSTPSRSKRTPCVVLVIITATPSLSMALPFLKCLHSGDSRNTAATAAATALGPMISANGPDCKWLNNLLTNTSVADTAAIAEAHAYGFAGYNLDFECSGINCAEHPTAPGEYEIVLQWLAKFAAAMHAASPRIGVP
jgi:hypothetical protein